MQDALKERSQRIYKEYGNVMLDTEGMSKVRRLPSTPEHSPLACHRHRKLCSWQCTLCIVYTNYGREWLCT